MARPNSFWSKAKPRGCSRTRKPDEHNVVNKGGAGWPSNNRASQRLNRGQHALQSLLGLLEEAA